VKRFSPDGSTWWDGTRWVPTSETHIVGPETEFERSGRLKAARRLMTIRDWAFAGFYLAGLSVFGIPLIPLVLVVYVVAQYRAFKGYREWTLELMALATAKLLDADEPMLAGETTLRALSGFWPRQKRDVAIAVTRDHVLLYLFDSFDHPAMRVIFGARAAEVELMLISGMTQRTLAATHSGRRWWITGIRGIFKGEAVLEAWRNSRLGGELPQVTRI
jgi:hypothetical protein